MKKFRFVIEVEAVCLEMVDAILVDRSHDDPNRFRAHSIVNGENDPDAAFAVLELICQEDLN